MVIDAITFGGEVEMLEGRMYELMPHIDYMVIIESNRTYTNRPKVYQFLEHFDRFQMFEEKFLYQPIEGLGSSDAWANDYHQRRAVGAFLSKMGLDDDDVVFLSDTDEWFDPALIPQVENLIYAIRLKKLHMSLHWFHKWETCGIAARWGNLKGKDVDALRWQRGTMPTLEGGWHLTSMGSHEYLVNKINSFAHQELNWAGVESELLDCWTNGHDLAGDWFTEINIDDTFPQWVKDRKAPADWYRRRHGR